MIVSWEYASFHYSPKPASPIFIAVLREKKRKRKTSQRKLTKSSLKQKSKGEHLHWRLQVNLARVA